MNPPIDQPDSTRPVASAPGAQPSAWRNAWPALRESVALCSLGHYEFLKVDGEDAQSFLQAQLTSDLRQATPAAAQYGGYCSPQGRLIANFLLIPLPEGYLIHLPSAMANPLRERLRKFVLRSRVRIEPAAQFRALGLAGPSAAGLVKKLGGAAPDATLEILRFAQVIALRLPGECFLLAGPDDELAPLRDRATTEAVVAEDPIWDWLQIRAGIAWILPPTQEKFVPQMIGLDSLGGVGFEKGCFPGQEIVARSRYLGQIKRHLRAGRTDAAAAAGDALFVNGQPCGTVLNVAPAPMGGHDLLAVVQDSLAEDSMLIGSEQGSRLKLGPPVFSDALVRS